MARPCKASFIEKLRKSDYYISQLLHYQMSRRKSCGKQLSHRVIFGGSEALEYTAYSPFSNLDLRNLTAKQAWIALEQMLLVTLFITIITIII